MCFGSGNVNFPDPNEVGAAQFAWNNFNQVTPYGGMNFTPPTFDENGNPTAAGTMEQWQTPEMQEMQEQMFGLRTGSMDMLSQLLGGGGGGGGFGGFNFGGGGGAPPTNPWAPPPVAGGGGGSDPPEYYPEANIMGGGGGGGPTGPTGTPMPDPGGPPVSNPDTPPWQFGDYGGSFTAQGDERLNPMFFSSNAPAIRDHYNMASLPGLLGRDDLIGERGRITQGKFDILKGLLDPVYENQDTALAQEYANRGMPVGSEEFDQRRGELADAQNRGYESAALQADQAGQKEMLALAGLSAQQRGQIFGEQGQQISVGNQARGQAFGEQMGVRQALMGDIMGIGGQQFQQLASILGLSQPPGAGGDLSQFYGPGPVDMMSAYGQNMQGQMYNAGNQIGGADLFSGLLGLGGQLGGAYLGR
jgi:hypothetical protein